MNDRFFVAHKLKLARNFHGYSLEEIGEKVAATRQYIQQLESRAKIPSGEMVAALADALDVEPLFFYQTDLTLPAEEECHFRSRQAKTIAVKNQALSQAALLENLVDELDEVIDFPIINIPSITSDQMDIESIAENVRNSWGLGINAPILDMTLAAENAGIVVGYFGDLSEKIDAFSKHGRRPIIVRNPSKESVCRMRFDIAHECGHLVMHQGRETGDKETEAEANRFASAFLLPRGAFISEFPRSSRFNWSVIYDLKLRWKVSAAAIVRRAYDLGLIDAAAYRRASIHMSKTGQAKQEYYDDIIPMESPRLLNDSISALQSQSPQLIKRIMGRMGVKSKIIERLVGCDLSSNNEYNNVVFLH